MNKIDLDKALGWLASLGVIAGILLLAYELNQNREMMRAQTRNDLAQTVVDLAIADSQDIVRADILVRGLNGETLSESEQWIHDRRTNAWFRYWENVHYQYRNGLYDQVEFSKQVEAMRRVVNTSPGMVDHWCRTRTTYSPEFAAEMDSLLSRYTCE